MTIAELAEKERELDSILDTLKQQIVEAVADAPALPGVAPAKDGSKSSTVRFSTICDSGHMFLSPGYYIQSAQAETIRAALAPLNRSYQIFDKLRPIAQTGRVKVGNVTEPLNPNTIAVIQGFLRT